MKNPIPIFFACNDKYVPYLDVAIISLISHASPDREYRIIVLKTDITAQNQEVILKHATSNVSIEFYDVQKMLAPVRDKLPEVFYYSLAAYYRFFIETAFPQYDKAIYLDCDVVLLNDIAKLYDTDVSNCLVGAVYEQNTDRSPEFTNYVEEIIGIPHNTYFNSGVIVMNLAEFRRQKVLTEIQQKRLSAIREYTEFGSGFKIAMRDLELRGAGNIMGAQQHGHMESVGYDMYLKLLGEAVNEEKGVETQNADLDCLIDLNIDAHIPESYVESLTLRLDVYRRIADIRSSEDADDVRDELVDRFGKIPPSVHGLIDVALIRNKAHSMGIYEIRQTDSSVNLFVKELKSPVVADLLIALNGKASLNAGTKPYLSIKCPSDKASVSVLKELFKL